MNDILYFKSAKITSKPTYMLELDFNKAFDAYKGH